MTAARERRVRLAEMTVAVGDTMAPLARDLTRFRARARGARIRELALLGLQLEGHGFRLTQDGQVAGPVGGVAGMAGATPLPSPAPPQEEPEGMRESHKRAINDLAASLTFDLDD